MKEPTLDIINENPDMKLLYQGLSSLSDVENLALIIAGKDAKTKAQNLMIKFHYNYNDIAKLNYHDLRSNKLSHLQSIRILTCNAYSKRKALQDTSIKNQIKMPEDVFDMLNPELQDLDHEEFWILFLNRANKVIGKYRVSQGGLSGTIIDIRLTFKKAIEYSASAIIAVHNHPSGNLNPSESDTKITQKIKEAGNIMDIQLLDHIIIAEKEYYSFADNGLL